MMGVDYSSLHVNYLSELEGLVWVLAAARCWVCIHQMNRDNSDNKTGRDKTYGIAAKRRKLGTSL